MLLLHTFGEEKPDADLVALMIKKAETYHCCQKPVTLQFGWQSEWHKNNGYPQEWFLSDPREPRGGEMNRLMVEACQGMMEGLYEGWRLGTKPARDKAEANRRRSYYRKHPEHLPIDYVSGTPFPPIPIKRR